MKNERKGVMGTNVRCAGRAVVIFFVLAAALPASGQTVTEVDSKISEVTVFLNRAQVVREVRAHIGAGKTNLVIGGLTSALDPQSIQVSGSGNAVILGIQHNQNYLDEGNKPPKLKHLEDSLEYYVTRLTKVQNDKAILEKEEKLMEANQKIGGTQQNLTVAELKAMADFFRARMSDIGAAKIDADEQIKDINEKITRLKKQIAEQRGLLSRNTSEIVVSVSAKASTQASLEVSYVVNDAGWYPVYDLRATDTKSPVMLNYKANVFQQTGESWENVKLTLSTANPAQGGQKPELYTWYLDFPRPMPLQEKAVRIRGAAAHRVADTAQMAESDFESVANYVSTIQTSLNTEFEIALPYTIPSTPKPTVVDIASHEVPATYRYATTPKLDRDAFLLARVTGWEAFSLLPGEANVFFEGTFVGKTFVDPANVRETLDVSLGRDKRIVVEREKVKDFTSRRTIGANRRDRYTWEISIRNTRNEPVKIMVEDHVPVSQNSQIEVAVDDTGGARYNTENGKLVWELALNPNETKKVRYSFEVKYPKDQVIPGLE
ncbi:MAG TPA: mucoidy inhibitor MuiA family protein [Cyclobacteriaceae bacterium]